MSEPIIGESPAQAPAESQPPPHPGVVGALEALLRDAQSGTLQGVVVIGIGTMGVLPVAVGSVSPPDVVWAFEKIKNRLLKAEEVAAAKQASTGLVSSWAEMEAQLKSQGAPPEVIARERAAWNKVKQGP